ncbi:16S rRNA (guanine(527)-N(7))-methyltransferase RsmG [Gracilimonas mengyeensis]|uniref:16S rRNA (guanine(527)-N(7))-methyltransferase RsmG n=1 Tax=Gracilimonas mengyeensis TaxID=1302730 RepID=UPI00163DC284|nr:RsmG family class I SAM-dependent methyltransferase [Gracilimonas mengyeensis]
MKHSIDYLDFSPESVAETKKLFKDNESSLVEYVSKLMWWNKKINLVSRDVSRETLMRHVEHSLTIATSELYSKASSIVDSGTGGGLPGIPLAIVSSDKEMVLNDIVSKKITACKHMASVLKLKNVEGGARSVEEVQPNEGALLVSKHAFKINDLYGMIGRLPYSGVILLKGKDDVRQELEGVKGSLQIKVFDLYSGFEDPFYKGKALVEITKKK